MICLPVETYRVAQLRQTSTRCGHTPILFLDRAFPLFFIRAFVYIYSMCKDNIILLASHSNTNLSSIRQYPTIPHSRFIYIYIHSFRKTVQPMPKQFVQDLIF